MTIYSNQSILIERFESNQSIFIESFESNQSILVERFESNSIFSEFCDYPITLYNETLRELICNNDNDDHISYQDIYPIDGNEIENYVEFIHLSKTGGESVEATLGLEKNQYKAMDYLRMQNILKPSVLSFTIIRNPYSRTFSWFKFCIHGWYDPRSGDMLIPYAPYSGNKTCNDCRYALDQWTNKYQNDTDITIKNAQIAFENWVYRAFIDNPHCMETNLPWNLYLSHSKSHLFLVDLIMRFETLKGDWDIFLEILGLNKSIHQLKHKNVDKLEGKNKIINITTPRMMIPSDKQLAKLLEKDWRYYYTEKSKKIVRDRFSVDFELFNYDIDF